MDCPTIVVRDMTFEVEQGAGGLWNAKRPELSHTLNAFQLALPYLEPYFIDAVKEASGALRDSRLRDEALAFCGQEANHSRQHGRYNRVLRRRYPRLAEFEKRSSSPSSKAVRRTPSPGASRTRRDTRPSPRNSVAGCS